jgi:AraC-like DNA-binding protein
MFMDAMEIAGIWEYVISGAIQYRLGSEVHRVEAGQVLVTRRPDPGWMLRPVKDTTVQTIWFGVMGQQAMDMFDYLHLQFGQIYAIPRQSKTIKMALELIRQVAINPKRSAHEWSMHTFRWMDQWWQDAKANQTRIGNAQLSAIDPSRLISYTPRTIKNFANEVGYSRSYLTRKLSKQWLRSPGKVLREVRLEEAAKLLRTTRLSITEVAHKVGYTSVAGFSRAFSQRFDKTPSAYRRSS